MKKSNRNRLLMTAVAGIALGVASPASAQEPLKAGEVKCFGVNACAAHARCAVAGDDIDAVKNLVGKKQFGQKFGKSEAHACGAHAKCGSGNGILNWTPASPASCGEQGGFIIDQSNGKKVAKKA